MIRKQEIYLICWVTKQRQLADSLAKIEGNVLSLINTITSGIRIGSELRSIFFQR